MPASRLRLGGNFDRIVLPTNKREANGSRKERNCASLGCWRCVPVCVCGENSTVPFDLFLAKDEVEVKRGWDSSRAIFTEHVASLQISFLGGMYEHLLHSSYSR